MEWTDRVVEYPNRIKLTAVEGENDVYDVERVEGEVTEEGTLLNAENLNATISEAISGAIEGIDIDSNGNVILPNLQSGSATVTIKKANTVYSKSVKFSKAFSQVPKVVVAAKTNNPSIVNCSVQNVTTTGFDIFLSRGNTTNTAVYWIAHL